MGVCWKGSDEPGKVVEKGLSWFTRTIRNFEGCGDMAYQKSGCVRRPFYITLAAVHFSTFQRPGHCVLSQAMHRRAFRAAPSVPA